VAIIELSLLPSKRAKTNQELLAGQLFHQLWVVDDELHAISFERRLVFIKEPFPELLELLSLSDARVDELL